MKSLPKKRSPAPGTFVPQKTVSTRRLSIANDHKLSGLREEAVQRLSTNPSLAHHRGDSMPLLSGREERVSTLLIKSNGFEPTHMPGHVRIPIHAKARVTSIPNSNSKISSSYIYGGLLMAFVAEGDGFDLGVNVLAGVEFESR